MKINQSKFCLTQEELWRLVKYDPETGQMWRIVKRHPRSQKEYQCFDEVIGTNNRGYKWLKIGQYMYLVHRLAVLWMTGQHPDGEVDHVNGDRQDNRWVNLRRCTPLDNSRNQGIRKDNTTGVRGVNYNTCKTNRSVKRWVARISHQGSRLLIGNFLTFDEAIAARKQAEIDFGYHPNHAKRESWGK